MTSGHDVYSGLKPKYRLAFAGLWVGAFVLALALNGLKAGLRSAASLAVVAVAFLVLAALAIGIVVSPRFRRLVADPGRVEPDSWTPKGAVPVIAVSLVLAVLLLYSI